LTLRESVNACDVIFWLLLGGTKTTQQRDIEKAISLAVAMKD
jgi:putative component of toxin-antitoxin plasmid stabilization module